MNPSDRVRENDSLELVSLRRRLALVESENLELRLKSAHSGAGIGTPFDPHNPALIAAQHKLAQRAAGVATWVWNITAGQVTWSEEFYEIYGLDPKQVAPSYEHWLRAIHPDDRPRVSGEMANASGHELAYDAQFRIVWPSGEIRWISAKGRVFSLDDGQLKLMIGASVDITDRRKLDEHRLALASIVESSEDAIIGQSLDGIITSWNRGAELLFGYRAGDALGHPIPFLAWPGHEDEMPEILGRIRQGQRVDHFEFETVRRHKDGRRIAVSLTVSPIRDAAGLVIGASKIARDITHRRQAEAALREAEQRYHDLFENSPLSIVVIDPETSRYLEFNHVFCERLGYTRDEIANLRAFDIDPNYGASSIKSLAEQLSIQDNLQFVTQHRTKSGELLDTLFSARPIRHEDRVLIHGTAVDISAQRREEAALRQLREKEALLKEIHHRVKNNLQVVSSLLGMQSREIRDLEMRKSFQESQNRIHSMALLHETLYQSENLSRIDFPKYIRQLAAYLFQSYGISGARIHLFTDLHTLYLTLDVAVHCGLIINELVSNSLKYAFPDGREGEIRIRLYEHSKGITRLVVADNGIGMRKDVDWTTTRSLGLRLVRTLALQLGAQIEVSSRGGTETQLTFSAAA